jgi:hypothetical protein
VPHDEKAPPPKRRRGALIAAAVAGGVLFAPLLGVWWMMIRMPGSSHEGALPKLDETDTVYRALLSQDLDELDDERNAEHPEALAKAADFIEARLKQDGYASVERQRFEAYGQPFDNLIVEIAGAGNAQNIVVVGAHYDSAVGAPGANDNGTGTAALLSLANAFAKYKPASTLRFVAFTNEEPPHYRSEAMGSLVYAKRCKERGDNVVAMLSLETMGYYVDDAGTQKYPFPLSVFYPDVGNFIAVVGDVSSRALVRQVVGTFRDSAQFPSQGAALPGAIPGVGWSDHWSFWQQGYPAVEITDTAPFRYPHYHTADDQQPHLDLARLARVVGGLEGVIHELVGGDGPIEPTERGRSSNK